MSLEGTTQGCNLASAFYSISTVALVRDLAEYRCRQTWFADDSSASGGLLELRKWWDKINVIGPALGYFPNAKKSWLIVKKEHLEVAEKIFGETDINLTTEGQRYLGTAIGTDAFVETFVEDKIKTWIEELEKLSEVALTNPQGAYAAYTFAWLYLMRTTPNVKENQ
eukprot:sb/3472428/